MSEDLDSKVSVSVTCSSFMEKGLVIMLEILIIPEGFDSIVSVSVACSCFMEKGVVIMLAIAIIPEGFDSIVSAFCFWKRN